LFDQIAKALALRIVRDLDNIARILLCLYVFCPNLFRNDIIFAGCDRLLQKSCVLLTHLTLDNVKKRKKKVIFSALIAKAFSREE
jgi:hypothetical protein